ncbi:MAG: hypothetical protein CME68_07865 [Halobacteriovoraceae bacterium]|nr:hypothetical protein [Halobacteriovoraceae bacterium]
MKTFDVGLKEELRWSRFFHERGVPVLVSQDLLRKRGLGQVDVCFFKKERGRIILKLIEVKSSPHTFFSQKQRRRLLGACSFLSKVFNVPSSLSLCIPTGF